MVGGGAGGLITGTLLARDGHDVTVIERDEAEPPADDEQAWESWRRPGVNQFRQPHGFIGRTRQAIADELPDLWEAFGNVRHGTVDLKRVSPEPDAPPGPGDDLLTVDVMRRTTFERLLAATAEATEGLKVRRGEIVKGLLEGPEDGPIPRVEGVVTDAGVEIGADLVVDAAGRRTPSPRWLRDLGSDVHEWSESDGFTYFTRWFRTHDGNYPELKAGFLGGFTPSLLSLIFPGDAGVFGIAMVGSGTDKMLRRLKDPEVFLEVARRLGPLMHWVDPTVSTPITDVRPMGAIQNRHLRFRVDGVPSATGIVNVADSATSTNPSLGRGIGIASEYALGLREVLRDAEDPREIVEEYDRLQEERLTPWLHDAVAADASLRALFASGMGETPAPQSGPSARTIMQRAAQVDMECWRRWMRVGQLFDLPAVCLEDEALMARARDAAAEAPPPAFHMTREELTELLD